MHLIRPISFVAVCLASALQAATAGASAPTGPPTSEEAQAAYFRFATAFVGRLISAGLPATLSPGKLAEINEFAYRQQLRGCDERREPDPDPFAPADAPPPPVVFNCTWESGERISLTWIANTGSWMVSDDATAAAASGMLLTGPKQDAPQVVAIPTVPMKPAEPEVEAPPPPVAVTSVPTPAVFSGANLQALPSPFVPPLRAEPPRGATPAGASTGPMPTPFGAAAR